MAGHSKWANIQHRKGAQDKKRAKIFSKCSKAIMSAVKSGGPDPDMNLTLRYAIDKARAANMPRDNIQRAIKSASGDGDGANYEEIVYEGYGAGGVAVMVKSLTDNRNRTAPELRKIFEKGGGNLGASGCVAHQFNRSAMFAVPKESIEEEPLFELVLEVGAEEVDDAGENWLVSGPPESYSDIKAALEGKELELRQSEVTMIPTLTVEVTEEGVASKVLKLIEALDDHEDVDTVYTNFDITDEVMQKLSEA